MKISGIIHFGTEKRFRGGADLSDLFMVFLGTPLEMLRTSHSIIIPIMVLAK